MMRLCPWGWVYGTIGHKTGILFWYLVKGLHEFINIIGGNKFNAPLFKVWKSFKIGCIMPPHL